MFEGTARNESEERVRLLRRFLFGNDEEPSLEVGTESNEPSFWLLVLRELENDKDFVLLDELPLR